MRKGPNLLDVILLLIQLTLFVFYFVRPTFIDDKVLVNLAKVIGSVPMLVGGVFIIWALINLQTNLSVFASPRRDGKLITKGIYGYVRHPIYSGIIMLAIGYSIFDLDPLKVMMTLLIALFFHFKASYEERKLEKTYPEYRDYEMSTGRFIPSFLHYKVTRASKEPAPVSEPVSEPDEREEPPVTWGDG